MSNNESFFSRLSMGFFKNNMSFQLPDRHEQIFTLISKDLIETPLYFKNTNMFATSQLDQNINVARIIGKVQDQNITLTEIVTDINIVGEKMNYLERQEIQKQVPFIFQ